MEDERGIVATVAASNKNDGSDDVRGRSEREVVVTACCLLSSLSPRPIHRNPPPPPTNGSWGHRWRRQ